MADRAPPFLSDAPALIGLCRERGRLPDRSFAWVGRNRGMFRIGQRRDARFRCASHRDRHRGPPECAEEIGGANPAPQQLELPGHLKAESDEQPSRLIISSRFGALISNSSAGVAYPRDRSPVTCKENHLSLQVCRIVLNGADARPNDPSGRAPKGPYDRGMAAPSGFS